ncbi:MAG: hypothetical protein KGL39_00235 [Patescibacteria group bacterium]|nr:hypothetical protein [Patescibacteria group bacterium]
MRKLVGGVLACLGIDRLSKGNVVICHDGYSPLADQRLLLDEIEQMDRSRWRMMYYLTKQSEETAKLV